MVLIVNTVAEGFLRWEFSDIVKSFVPSSMCCFCLHGIVIGKFRLLKVY